MPRTKRTQGKGSHGLLKNGAKPPEYAIWKAMIQKCCNERCVEFKHYGEQGIRVSERWCEKKGFANFLADVGPQAFAGAGLRLVDPKGNFEPGNVEWGDTRTKHMLTLEGRTQSLAAWAHELGINERTLRGRLRTGGTAKQILNRQVKDLDYLAWYRTQKRKSTRVAKRQRNDVS